MDRQKQIYSIAEARNSLPALVHQAETSSAVQLSRRGKPVAMIISIADYQKMIENSLDWWSLVQQQRASGHLSAEAADGEFEGLRSKEAGRTVDF